MSDLNEAAFEVHNAKLVQCKVQIADWGRPRELTIDVEKRHFHLQVATCYPCPTCVERDNFMKSRFNPALAPFKPEVEEQSLYYSFTVPQGEKDEDTKLTAFSAAKILKEHAFPSVEFELKSVDLSDGRIMQFGDAVQKEDGTSSVPVVIVNPAGVGEGRNPKAGGGKTPGKNPQAPLLASDLDPSDQGQPSWNPEFSKKHLTLTNQGKTAEWTSSEELCWIGAESNLRFHSGKYEVEFHVQNLGARQIGIGFMVVFNGGVDWGFYGYLGSSSTAWSYDPSTGDVVSATGSIEGGLPKLPAAGGIVKLVVDLPRQVSTSSGAKSEEDSGGSATFIVAGVKSKPIQLPSGIVVMPAGCFLGKGQQITLQAFSKTEVA